MKLIYSIFCRNCVLGYRLRTSRLSRSVHQSGTVPQLAEKQPGRFVPMQLNIQQTTCSIIIYLLWFLLNFFCKRDVLIYTSSHSKTGNGAFNNSRMLISSTVLRGRTPGQSRCPPNKYFKVTFKYLISLFLALITETLSVISSDY